VIKNEQGESAKAGLDWIGKLGWREDGTRMTVFARIALA
jgi:hypothetical protein